MQDGPMRPANRMNDSEVEVLGKIFGKLFVLAVFFWFLVGADCTAIWLMK